MGSLAHTFIVSGCGVTDYLLTKEIRELCDIWLFLAGFALILFIVFCKKRTFRGSKL